MRLAHLDWSISKNQIINPFTSELISQYILVRDDTHKYLSIVGEKYTPIQNQYCFDFVDALLESGEAHYESAGALGNGETVWCLASLNQKFSPVKGDEHKTYLLFTDSRDGNAATVKLTTTRVVCSNTLSIALKNKDITQSVLRLRHTTGINDKLLAAKSLIKDVSFNIKTLNDKLKELSKVKLNKKSYTTILDCLFGAVEKSARKSNMCAIISDNFSKNDDNAFPEIQGTAYALLQACTRFSDHQKEGFRLSETTLQKKRAEEAIFGSGDQFKRDALYVIENVCLTPEQIDTHAFAPAGVN